MKVGDVVQLRSGGPAMTVSNVSDDGTTVDVEWFYEGERNRATFLVQTLVGGAAYGAE